MKKILSLLLCVALLAGIAACGLADSDPRPSPTPTPPPDNTQPSDPDDPDPPPPPTVDIQYSQGADETTVRVGNSATQSGALAIVGVPFNAGIEAYFRMVNEGGGIDGRTIEFWNTDDEFDPAKGKAALEEMVEDEKLFAIVGALGTPVVAAIIDDLKDYGIPAVYFATGIPQLHANGARTNQEGFNIFPVQPLYETEGRILLAFASGRFDATTVGIIYANDDAGITLLRGAQQQADELPGITLVAEQVVAGSPDVSAAVTSLRSAGVDMIIAAAIQDTLPAIVKEIAAQGMTVPVITTYVNAGADISVAVVDDITGRFDLYATGWVDALDMESFEVYAQWIPEDYAFNAFAMAGWIAGATFAEGLRRIAGQDITWENYMRALEEAPINLPFGAAVDYADGNRWGTQSMNLSKVVPVSDEFAAGWEIVFPMTNMKDLIN
ncbi:MAG: ABC transporter substrate-binding protein [Oscillospiraceae bacterium]|nr:ABC transporter substrate-binding protein [Oscillospiraceae bacterium]